MASAMRGYFTFYSTDVPPDRAFFLRFGPGLTGPVCGLASSAAYGWNRWGML